MWKYLLAPCEANFGQTQISINKTMLNCFDGNSLITFLYIIFIVSTMLCKTELCGWVNQRLLPPGFCLGEAIGSYCRKVEENKVIMIISPLPSFLLRFFFFFFWQLLHFSTKALLLVAFSCCCGSFSELWSCTSHCPSALEAVMPPCCC